MPISLSTLSCPRSVFPSTPQLLNFPLSAFQFPLSVVSCPLSLRHVFFFRHRIENISHHLGWFVHCHVWDLDRPLGRLTFLSWIQFHRHALERIVHLALRH